MCVSNRVTRERNRGGPGGGPEATADDESDSMRKSRTVGELTPLLDTRFGALSLS
jgi:hypothetical protein